MTQLLVATRSRGKQEEFRTLLAQLPYEIVFPDDIGMRESPEEQELEVHDTFEANARAKAQWFASRSGLATLADDSGLEVDALGGAPGVRSKRFGGLGGLDHEVTAANNAKLLHALHRVAEGHRSARYRCVLVLIRPGSPEVVAVGTTEGQIALSATGDGGFGYDPLFVSAELGRSFGEAGPAAKHAVSHRARAVEALAGRLA